MLLSLSREDEWTACLPAFYILSSPAASLWLLPWLKRTCACVYRERPSEQQEYIISQTKGSGIWFMNY